MRGGATAKSPGGRADRGDTSSFKYNNFYLEYPLDALLGPSFDAFSLASNSESGYNARTLGYWYALLDRGGRDLPRFYAEVRALAKLDRKARAARLGLPDAPAQSNHDATVASACGSAAADSRPPAGS